MPPSTLNSQELLELATAEAAKAFDTCGPPDAKTGRVDGDFDYFEVATCPSHGPNLYHCSVHCRFNRAFLRAINIRIRQAKGPFSMFGPKAQPRLVK